MNTFKHFSNAGKTLPSKIKHQNEIARKTEDILIFRAIFLTLQFSFTFPILSHSTKNITHFRRFLPLPIQFHPFPPFSTFLRFPCQLTTWSNSDQNVILNEADLKEQSLHDMFYTHWVDLQRLHQRMYGFTRQMNLTNALGSMQIYFEGTEHGALADARNTAKILKRLSNLQDVRERIQQSHITYNDSQSHGFTMGLVFKKK